MTSAGRDAAVAYLLDELDGAQRAGFERRLAAEPGLRAEVEALRPVVGRLERLSPAAWNAPDPPAPPPVPDPSPGFSAVVSAQAGRRRAAGGHRVVLPVWGLAAATCVLLALAVAGGAALDGDGEGGATGPNASARAIVLEPVGGGDGASGRIELGADEAAVRVRGLRPVAAGEYYELWLLSSPSDLVSLGSFRVSSAGDATLRVPVPVDPRAYRFLDVSHEPGDGDPRHSKRSVLRAPIRLS